MEDFKKLSEQMDRIEEQQKTILELLEKFKNDTFINFSRIANRLDNNIPIPGISNLG